MTDTVHLSLLQRITATMQALPSVPADRVYVERVSPIDRDECPAINLVPGDGRFESIGSDDGVYDLLRATMTFIVKVHTRVDQQTAGADAVISQAHQALFADPTLGGYALRLALRSSRPQAALADGTAGVYELGYEATVVVSERDMAMRPV